MTRFPASLKRFPTLRQSRLATFDRCALSAHFEETYEAGWSSHPQGRGTIFHRFAAKALREMVAQGEPTIPQDVSLAILAECLRQHDVDKECPTCGKKITKRKGDRIICAKGHDHSSGFVNLPSEEVKDLRWVTVKWATDNAFDIQNLVDIETRLEAVIRYPDEKGGFVERILTGQLDALFVTGEDDDEAIVLDWKDTWMLPAPTEVGFDGYFQQRFYAWLVFANYPSIQKVTLREFYVRYSEPREATVWRQDLEEVEAELAALAERYDRAFEEEIFPPSPGHHCQLCPRPGACPIFSGVRQEGAITDAKTAKKVAGEATVIKAALDQRTKALRAYSTVHGPVPISDHKGKRAWGFVERPRVSRPSKEDLEAAIAIAGGAENVNIDALYKTSRTTRYTPHVPSDVEDTADDAALMNALEQSIEARR